MKKIIFLLLFLACYHAGFSQATGIVIANLPTGGSMGTVDNGSYFNINQTTAGQTITVPNPSVTTNTKNIRIRNTGTTAFTLAPGGVCNPSTYGIELDWTGSTWAIMSNASTTGGGGGITTASNGLTATGTNVKLGGTLTGNTVITGGVNNLTITGDTLITNVTNSTIISTVNSTYNSYLSLGTGNGLGGTLRSVFAYRDIATSSNSFLYVDRFQAFLNFTSGATSRLSCEAGGVGMSTNGFTVFFKTTNPSTNSTVTIPPNTGNMVIDNATQTLTNKTISGVARPATNGVNSDYSGVANTMVHLPASTLTINRNFIMPTGSDGDVIEIYNNEVSFVWNLTGGAVYLSDGVTVLTSLYANTNHLIKKVDGLWRILN